MNDFQDSQQCNALFGMAPHAQIPVHAFVLEPRDSFTVT